METIRLEKVIPEKNQSRYYSLRIEINLFGEFSLILDWGRIGRSCRTVSTPFPDYDTAVAAMDKKVSEKLKRGYVSTT
jgi:predicted DNA-binding WGR domain protein